MEKKIVIFGAGEWGKIAYHYYKEDMKIAYYVDNDQTIWDTKVNGLLVCSPDILKEEKYIVIIANKRFENEIKTQLLCDYNINKVIVFRINEKMQELYLPNSKGFRMEELIIAFSHGLGNQMFQYALYRNFLKQGKKVKADLSAYIKPSMMPFELLNFFPNIKLEYCNPEEKDFYLKERKEKVYIEEPPRGEKKLTYNEEVLKMNKGYIEGFHCSYKYPELVRKELLEDFSFTIKNDSKLNELKVQFEKKEIVGVHVRRGDFLSSKYNREAGRICTKEYYLKAIEYIKTKVSNPFFCFFSNVIKWVKDNLIEKNTLYIDNDMFEKYYDWYDMYLMSICKHNIIPNSTFGWWGAWLNQNPEKIVIAPQKWRTRWEANDWCPPEWILI